MIFCSISEAIKEHPDLVKKYLGSVVPQSDNFFATLNSAVFSDGSFVYIPPGTRCPMELSTYFRINAENTGQFERTLIIADKGSYAVSYTHLDVYKRQHRAAIGGVRVQHDGNWRIAFLLRVVAAFKAAIWACENNFGHVHSRACLSRAIC